MQNNLKGVKSNLPKSQIQRPSREDAESAVRTLLLWAGDNPDREGLRDTPKRVTKAYEELFSGYQQSAQTVLGTFFEEVEGYSEPVLLRDIAFFSHCEHHMVPITGKAHIAYVPNGRVIGLSKLARLVDVFARRLQTQESLTAQISRNLSEYLQPLGLAVLLEAEHMCMAMRGVHKVGAKTITTNFFGTYAVDSSAQSVFLQMVIPRL
ncbi:GTP cyclohydrolase I FolE [Bartonella sp. DGB2]|uniref:GTP cyclohydrolase I FolE n=1 Tax=Bartonella sp. DGB2 TaxID=3388426 RepID=UPI0039903817